MAFRSRRFGRGRRFGARTKKPRWTGDFLTDPIVVAGQALGQFNLLIPGDYELSAFLEQGGGARFERLVGNLNLYANVGVAEWAAAIYAIDVAAAAAVFGGTYDPGQFLSLRDGDVIWWACGLAQPLPGPITRINWDIRVKRKLESTAIVLVISDYAVAANTITFHAGFRMLLANT